MSIAGTVLQFLTISALRENETLAGDAIIGTPIDPISQDFQKVSRPTVAVFTGEDRRTEITGRDLVNAGREIELSLQIYTPDAVKVLVDGKPVRIGTRGEGGDIVIDILARQIERALLASDTPSAILWRKLVTGIGSATAAPFMFETETVRIAVTEISYVCQTLNDPSFGDEDLQYFWADAIDAIKADPDYGAIGSWLEAEVQSPAGLSAGRIAQADIGTTGEAAVELGIAEIEDPSDPVASIMVVSNRSTVTVDPATAEQEDPTP